MSKLGVSLWTMEGVGPSLGETMGPPRDPFESERRAEGMEMGREPKYWPPSPPW